MDMSDICNCEDVKMMQRFVGWAWTIGGGIIGYIVAPGYSMTFAMLGFILSQFYPIDPTQSCLCSPCTKCKTDYPPFDPFALPDWHKPQSALPKVDPLILDLNRDGKIELKNATFFDLNANGFKEYTTWIEDTDAFLVLDKNFNGTLDDGSELFGDAMILPDGSRALTGFDALRAFDSNGDGKIDASDEIYASLKVLTGAGEMASLSDVVDVR